MAFVFSRTVVVCALVMCLGPASRASAQQAALAGTVVDESSAPVPGATVHATLVTTGRVFTVVTNERGEYRIGGLPAGLYTIGVDLQGFASVRLSEFELLVGQSATVPITMKVETVQETVTVSGIAPLVDTQRAQVATNVDRRQMTELPISGRNWLALTTMVKGVTANTITLTPGVGQTARFKINLDGQEVTQETATPSFGQPGISREAIAEYQVVTSNFDVTQGRSAGLQIQAISRSGTNSLNGSLYGYFRSDTLNAADHFTGNVLPYENQQVGGTLGGPIARNRMFYFVSYEYEREPATQVLAPAIFSPQTIQLATNTYQQYLLGRYDYQMNSRNNLSIRANLWGWDVPQTFRAHPSGAAERTRDSYALNGTWSRALSNNLMHQIQGGYFNYQFFNNPLEPATPEYVFPGLTVGSNWNWPSNRYQTIYNGRSDWMWSKGAHDLKFGFEARRGVDDGWWMARARGQMFFRALPADAARRFPLDAWNDPSRWDLTGLDALATRFDISYARLGGGKFGYGNRSNYVPRPAIAGWLGDTWAVGKRLTLNLGVRYDVGWGDFAVPLVEETDLIINNGLFTENVGYRHDIRDLNNIAPRVGFAWNVGNGDLIVRGGTGIYYATAGTNHVVDQQLMNGQRVLASSFVNDGRPGFVMDPTRGVTSEDVLSGAVPLPPQAISVMSTGYRMPRSWQSMLGFQKQLTNVMAFDADLIYHKGTDEDMQREANVFYDPATGLGRNPNTFGRPRPDFGPVNVKESSGYSDQLSLATSFTRRYANRFQVHGTYTLMFFKNDTGIGNQGYGAPQISPFDVGLDWARSIEFQRHTVNLNGVWTLPYDTQLSGSYHYGSGNYSQITSPVDPLGMGGDRRVRADLTLIPRNTFEEDPWHSLDTRLSKDLRVGGLRVTGMWEVFNLLNYARFNRNQIENHALFGQATSAGNGPRTMQLAAKVAW